MTDAPVATSAAPPERRRIPDGVVGMLIFIVTEIMFFAAFISAYLIVSAGALAWPPPDQPRLPAEATAATTLLLLISGALMVPVARAFKAGDLDKTRKLLFVSVALGTAFVAFQGIEWVRLIKYGLTFTSSNYGAFFYLIIGTHAIHAVAAIGGLFYVYSNLRKGVLKGSQLWTAQTFWYFVVGIWPILYITVYL
jgi:heme/copper-type cytochrome/quinol oxidase subunit 3